MHKRGASQYISWILIFGLVVAISFVLYKWSIDLAQKTGEDLQTRTDPLVCGEVGMVIEGICQDYRSLQMNITNANNLQIDGFLIRTVGLYPEDDDYLDSLTVWQDLRPRDTQTIIALKRGTLSQVEIIPIAVKNKKNIYCESQSVKKEKRELLEC